MPPIWRNVSAKTETSFPFNTDYVNTGSAGSVPSPVVFPIFFMCLENSQFVPRRRHHDSIELLVVEVGVKPVIYLHGILKPFHVIVMHPPGANCVTRCIESCLRLDKETEFDHFCVETWMITPIAPWICLETDDHLSHFIELACGVMKDLLTMVMSIVNGVLDSCGALEHFLVDQFSCESVPERDYVESINCSENIAFLRPYKVVVLAL